MRLPVRQAIGLCLLLAGIGIAAPAPVAGALRYKFKVGEKLHYESQQKMVITMDLAGKEVSITMTQTLDMVWTTLARDKDGSKISQTVERLRFVLEGPDIIGKGQFDSRDGKMPEGPVFAKVGPLFKSMVGRPVPMTVEPSGKTKDVKIPEAMQKELKALEDDNKANGTSSESLKKLFGQGDLILPNFSATKGKVWEHTEVSQVPGGKLAIRHVYEHSGVERRGGKKVDVITIKPTSKLESDGSKTGVKLKSQEASGKAYVDRAAGRLVESTVTLKMELETDVGGTSVTQKMEQTTSMKLKDK
jgi:hypothetical protein